MSSIEELLTAFKNNEMTLEEAALKLRSVDSVDLGFANVDLQRKARRGTSEVIYGASKTPEQIYKIAQTLLEHGQSPVLITRMNEEAANYISHKLDLRYDSVSRTGILGDMPEPDGLGRIAVVTAGTSDLPVAEEAAVTASFLGNEVERIYDVGVAGIHRLLARVESLRRAQVVIAIAGMEGALASVVGGLVDVPVIGVPTSVGYGAAFDGLAALLSMINSCAAGVSVVNIDNGFGAAYMASRINHIIKKV